MGEFRLGVDYGTSHTAAVLAWPDGRTRPLMFDGTPLLPSAVAVDGDGPLLTGAEALRAARARPASAEPNPKRRITDGDVLLGERSYPVSTLIAATLRIVAEEAARVTGRGALRVTVTHPAGWGATRRGVLAAALADAGLDAAAFLPEPVAAARFFTAMPSAKIPVGEHVAVYDLGAGTCDVSVLRRTATGFETAGVGGLDDVGGLDLDAVIVERLTSAVTGDDAGAWRRMLDGEDARRRHELWQDVRAAKESLSRRSSAFVHVPVLDRDLLVSREDFEAAARPVLERTIGLTRNVVAASGLSVEGLAGIYVVGGASRVPLVVTMLHQATGIRPKSVEQPELAVAEGATLEWAAPTAPATVPDPAPDGPPTIPDTPPRTTAPTASATTPLPLPNPPPPTVRTSPPSPPGPLSDPSPPPRVAWFDFTPPKDLRSRELVTRTVSGTLFALPFAVFFIDPIGTAVIRDFLVGELGLAPVGALLVLCSVWAPAAWVTSLIPKHIEGCRVGVDDAGISLVRGKKTDRYRWDQVKGFAIEKGRLVLNARYPTPGGSGFVPAAHVLGDPDWLRSGRRSFSTVVRERSGGRFDPL